MRSPPGIRAGYHVGALVGNGVCFFGMGVPLDQILRALQPGGEVELSLEHFPVDEILLALHETRFSGLMQVGHPEDADRVAFRDGKVFDVIPCRYIHVQALSRILLETAAVDGKQLRGLIEEDANIDGFTLGERLRERGLIEQTALEASWVEQARRRLFYLYDHMDAPVLVRQGEVSDWSFAPESAVIDILPAVSYGIVTRSDPARRRAMLAFAANKRASLLSSYDVHRNRCGLPGPLVEAAAKMSGDGVVFGPVPTLPGLTPNSTAGLLLLFQRIALLNLEEGTPSESFPPTRAV